MGLQFVSIKDSKVSFADEKKDPIKKTEHDLANVTFQGMMDKMKIEQLETETSTLAFEIMQLKMGGK